MRFRTFCFPVFILLFFTSAVFSQAKPPKVAPTPAPLSGSIKSSPAYIELILHKANIEAELLDMQVEYTDEYPKVKELRLEVQFVQAELVSLQELNVSVLPKLTESLARLLLQKIRMQVDLAQLRAAHKDDHPDVKRAMRRVDIYEKAIKDVLQ
ncbi:MAG TPA: hypothetical protein VGO50_09540 [Pyrinomonadaceae bacterium]|jgi:hypothetical protein|nr:hypothetical protein [Pyrinomonadaceae bacterium]